MVSNNHTVVSFIDVEKFSMLNRSVKSGQTSLRDLSLGVHICFVYNEVLSDGLVIPLNL